MDQKDSLSSQDAISILSKLPASILSSLPSALSSPHLVIRSTALTGGLTNTNHLVQVLQATSSFNQAPSDPSTLQDDSDSRTTLLKVVLRQISQSSTFHLNIDRISEIRNSQLAFEWGLAPKVLSVIEENQDAESGKSELKPKAMLIDYVEGRTLSNQDIQELCSSKGGAEKIVDVLARLHGSGDESRRDESMDKDKDTQTFENRFDIVEIRNVYLEVCKREGWSLPPDYHQLETSLHEIISILDPQSDTSASNSREKLVPCHNDLLAANFLQTSEDLTSCGNGIISNGEVTSKPSSHLSTLADPHLKSRTCLKLIDFEYSGLNYPSFDLGNFYSEIELNEEQLRNLISVYWSSRRGDINSAPNLESKFINSKLARAKLWAGVAQMCWVVWATIQANSILAEKGPEGVKEAQDGTANGKLEVELEKRSQEYLEWREVKLKSARGLLGEVGRERREMLIRDVVKEWSMQHKERKHR